MSFPILHCQQDFCMAKQVISQNKTLDGATGYKVKMSSCGAPAYLKNKKEKFA